MHIDESPEEKFQRLEKELEVNKKAVIKSGKGLCFWLGVVFSLCVDVLYQDFLGKEAYLEMVETSWINIPWQIWLIPMILILYAHHKIKKDQD